MIKNCASRWSFTKNHNMMHGQQNVNFCVISSSMKFPVSNNVTLLVFNGITTNSSAVIYRAVFYINTWGKMRRVKCVLFLKFPFIPDGFTRPLRPTEPRQFAMNPTTSFVRSSFYLQRNKITEHCNIQGYISDFTWHRVYIQFTRTPDRYNIRFKTARSIQIWTKNLQTKQQRSDILKTITMNVN
jgi:hypothetical protein